METEIVPTNEEVAVTEPVVVAEVPKPRATAVSESLFSLPTAVVDDESARSAIYFLESSGKLDAVNNDSGACGLGQSLPCSKLSNVCPNWQGDLECQDNYFTSYVTGRYGSWLNGYNFWAAHRWY